MSDEDELQEKLGNRDEYGLLPPPLPHEKRRLDSVPCIKHGLDPDCGCTATIDVELDIYHIGVLYPGLIYEALQAYFEKHKPELAAAFAKEGVGL